MDAIRAHVDHEDEELEVYFNDPYDEEDTTITYRSYDLVGEQVEKVIFDGIQVWPANTNAISGGPYVLPKRITQ